MERGENILFGSRFLMIKAVFLYICSRSRENQTNVIIVYNNINDDDGESGLFYDLIKFIFYVGGFYIFLICELFSSKIESVCHKSVIGKLNVFL